MRLFILVQTIVVVVRQAEFSTDTDRRSSDYMFMSGPTAFHTDSKHFDDIKNWFGLPLGSLKSILNFLLRVSTFQTMK